MAENEIKTNKENHTSGGGNRRPHRGGHGRPHHGGRPKPQQDKQAATTANAEGGEKKQRPPRHNEGRPHRNHEEKNARRNDEHKAAENKGEHKGGKRPQHRPHKEEAPVREQATKKPEAKKPASGRMSFVAERQTAEQKAFDEAKDIMLEAQNGQTDSAPTTEEEKNIEVVGIRFKQTGKIYYFAPAGISFDMGEGVIVETARGQEYGFVALPNRMVSENETVQPLKEVIRKATEADGVKHTQNKELEKKAAAVWEELVKKHKLVMSLTEVEYTFDNSKLIFYFTAEGRVDFRELVKDLASVFRTRIELRQIGVRDEAKFLGGLGVCGMPFCCNRFLPDFVQVSIKMAKEQNLSLSSSKISGNCGRLMCCLRYEQDVYEKEYATFPRTDMVVRTAVGTGVITESNFINGKIKVRMDGDGAAVYKIFTRDEVKVIGKAKTHNDEALEKELKALED